MTKCAYCSNEAIFTDALGLDACARHAGEADNYVRELVIDTPMRRHPLVQELAKDVGQDFVDASDHKWWCTCDKCREWWRKMGRDPDTKLYGPFGDSLVPWDKGDKRVCAKSDAIEP